MKHVIALSHTWSENTTKCTAKLVASNQTSYHLPDVGEETVTKILCGFDWQLSRKVVNGAHENPVSLHAAGTTNKTKSNVKIQAFYSFKKKQKTVARIQFDGSLKEVRRGQQKAEKASSTKKKQLCVYLGRLSIDL